MTVRLLLPCLAVWTLGCDHRERAARIDAEVDLARLRAAGVSVRIEEAAGNPAERLAEVRSAEGPEATVLVISPVTVLASYGRDLDQRLSNKRSSYALAWSHAFVHEGDQAGAVRAAARGLLLDAMSVGLLPPRPLSPIDPPQSERLHRDRPSRGGVWGPLLALALALFGVRRKI